MEMVVRFIGISSAATLPDDPFRPGFGRLPPFLEGRGKEKDHLRTLIRRIRARERDSEVVLLHGLRGNGKTALIGWPESEAGDSLNLRQNKVRFIPTRRRLWKTCSAATRTRALRRRRTERSAVECPGIDGPGGFPGKSKRPSPETVRQRGRAGIRRAPRITQIPVRRAESRTCERIR